MIFIQVSIMSSQIIRSVLKDYETDRDNAERLRNQRLLRMYDLSPRLREIDNRLPELGLDVARRILAGGDSAALTAELAAENEALLSERQVIIDSLGEPSVGYACCVCNDTGFVDGGRCGCFKQRIINKFYELSNLSKVLKRENFDTFNMDLYSAEKDPKTGVSPKGHMQKIWAHALNFVKDFDETFTNLMFYGNTGLGKTFLCNCIAKDLLDRGKSVLYVTSPQLFKMVEKVRFDKDDEGIGETEEFLSLVLTSDLLIIDDLGTEVSTVVTASELFNILNDRLLNRRPTILSTNFEPSEIEGIYSDRITSRIFGNYTICKFSGEDIRIKIRYKI